VTRGTVAATVTASGAIASARTRALSFAGNGVVESIGVEPGDRVKKGQVLARLDDTEARETLDEAQASLTAAEDGDTSTPAGHSQYVTARNAYNQADRALDGIVLKAPFSGTVTAVNGTVGGGSSGGQSTTKSTGNASENGNRGNNNDSASAGTTTTGTGFVELADTSRLQVVGNFTESDVTRLKRGRPAAISFDALPEITATGKVTSISPVAQTSNNVVQYPVAITLDKAPKGVRLGQTTSVEVSVEEAEDVLVVPTSAVRKEGAQSTVLVMVNGNPVARTVETGLSGDQTTEIRSGLREGDRVVRQAESPDGRQGVFPGMRRVAGGGR
jgi:macrolide-specific efflux system membrane fusion protein